MKHWKMAVASLVVLALLALPLLGCGDDKGDEEEKVTVRVGYLTDMTGAASSAMLPNRWAILDAWEYLEKNDPIPGVKLKLESYDTQLNPARAIPGYEWLKERGVVVMYSYMPQITDIISAFLERDKMPSFSHTATEIQLANPWVFISGLSLAEQFTLSLKWLSDNWANYPTKPKVGAVGWNTSYEMDIAPAMRDYCLSHPDDFEWVGSYMAPAGTMTWSGEVEALKDCDWVSPIHAGGAGHATFIEQFRAAGYTAKFFGGEAMPCWTGMIIDKVGWQGVDGSFTAQTYPWWTDENIMVDVGKEALVRNHPGETELSLGYGYLSQVAAQFFWYKLIKAAIEEAGAENVDGQSCYNSFIKFSCTLPDHPEQGYTETSRINMRYGRIYNWSGSANNIERITDWILAPTS